MVSNCARCVYKLDTRCASYILRETKVFDKNNNNGHYLSIKRDTLQEAVVGCYNDRTFILKKRLASFNEMLIYSCQCENILNKISFPEDCLWGFLCFLLLPEKRWPHQQKTALTLETKIPRQYTMVMSLERHGRCHIVNYKMVIFKWETSIKNQLSRKSRIRFEYVSMCTHRLYVYHLVMITFLMIKLMCFRGTE